MLRILVYISLFSMIWFSSSGQNVSPGQLYAGPSDYAIDINLNTSLKHSWNHVDDIVANTNPEHFSSIENLAIYLTKQFSEESDKVRSIYSWIAFNISYDQKSILDQSTKDSQTAKNVWKNQMAVCKGFANLLYEMCTAAGIESRIIKGYVKNLVGSDLRFPNHVWNGVKIDGKWKLLDVTWASINNEGSLLANAELQKSFARRKLDYFYLVNPEKMILTHLPEDPYWQLQNNYISMEIFLNGEYYINSTLMNPYAEVKDFEQLIENHENLDSLDRSIAYLERMERNKWNKAREYGLGIAYYYKAQSILKNAFQKNRCHAIKKAKIYYKKSLNQLEILQEEDYGYEFSKDLAKSLEIRIESLQ